MKGWGSSFHTVGLGTVDGVVSLRTGGRRDGMSFPVQTLATTMAKLLDDERKNYACKVLRFRVQGPGSGFRV